MKKVVKIGLVAVSARKNGGYFSFVIWLICVVITMQNLSTCVV